jgi:hypothetical protein
VTAEAAAAFAVIGDAETNAPASTAGSSNRMVRRAFCPDGVLRDMDI